jgi:endonuclease-3 related protein
MDVKKVYEQFKKKYGHQQWWPIFIIHNTKFIIPKLAYTEHGLVYGVPCNQLKKLKTNFRDPYFEIAVGAILTQNTAWKNVAVAIKNLYEAKALTPERLLKLNTLKLQKLIRPAGYFRQKAKKLRIFSKWLVDGYNGQIEILKDLKIKDLRLRLLERWGVGPETADSIILYALNKPIFVIDEYTRRLCKQHGIVFKEYDEYREMFQSALPKSAKLFQECHALIVAWGKSQATCLRPPAQTGRQASHVSRDKDS